MGWFHHWLYLDLYVPLWPNLAADLVLSTWILRRVKKHLHRHHEAIKAVVAATEKPPPVPL